MGQTSTVLPLADPFFHPVPQIFGPLEAVQT